MIQKKRCFIYKSIYSTEKKTEGKIGNDKDYVQRLQILRKNIRSKRKNAKTAQSTHG